MTTSAMLSVPPLLFLIPCSSPFFLPLSPPRSPVTSDPLSSLLHLLSPYLNLGCISTTRTIVVPLIIRSTCFLIIIFLSHRHKHFCGEREPFYGQWISIAFRFSPGVSHLTPSRALRLRQISQVWARHVAVFT